MEHYFSAEFLMGRALLNNLSNLGLVEQARTSSTPSARTYLKSWKKSPTPL